MPGNQDSTTAHLCEDSVTVGRQTWDLQIYSYIQHKFKLSQYRQLGCGEKPQIPRPGLLQSSARRKQCWQCVLHFRNSRGAGSGTTAGERGRGPGAVGPFKVQHFMTRRLIYLTLWHVRECGNGQREMMVKHLNSFQHPLINNTFTLTFKTQYAILTNPHSQSSSCQIAKKYWICEEHWKAS